MTTKIDITKIWYVAIKLQPVINLVSDHSKIDGSIQESAYSLAKLSGYNEDKFLSDAYIKEIKNQPASISWSFR